MIRQRSWEFVYHQIAAARSRIWVLQTWLPRLRANRELWAMALERGAKARVLLLDQSLVPHRLKGRERTSGLLPQNASDLIDLAKHFNLPNRTALEGRFYSNLPLGPTYIIDDHVFWGLYYANADAMNGPAFHVSARSPVGKRIIDSYQTTWDMGHHSSGDLHLPGPSPLSLSLHPEDQLESKLTAQVARTKGTLVRLPSDALPTYPAAEGLIVFLRHGYTDLSSTNVFIGGLEVGINARGREEARVAQRQLQGRKWDHIYSSPLRRANDTAVLVAGPESAINHRYELTERWMGRLEGFDKESYQESFPNEPRLLPGNLTSKATGGESHADVLVRLMPLLEEMIVLAEEGENFLVITHEAPLRMIQWALEPSLDQKSALKREIPFCIPIAYGTAPRPGTESRVGTVLFTDIIGSTSILQEVGEADGNQCFRYHEDQATSIINANGGHVVKPGGDGVMAMFPDAPAAIRSGLRIVEEGRTRPFLRADGEKIEVPVRVGIASGVVEVEPTDIRGATVVIASRLANIETDQPGVYVIHSLLESVTDMDLRSDSLGTVDLQGLGTSEVVRIIGDAGAP